jgi:hypothetical protein
LAESLELCLNILGKISNYQLSDCFITQESASELLLSNAAKYFTVQPKLAMKLLQIAEIAASILKVNMLEPLQQLMATRQFSPDLAREVSLIWMNMGAQQTDLHNLATHLGNHFGLVQGGSNEVLVDLKWQLLSEEKYVFLTQLGANF